MAARKIERKRSLRSSGRKLCDTIILEDDEVQPEELVSSSKKTTSSLRPEDIILVEETEDEDEGEEDATVLIAGADNLYTAKKETGLLETSFLEAAAEADETPLEEWSTISWELREFKGNLKYYVPDSPDDESKYLDENEAVPLRTSLIDTGHKIGIPSIFLANLYLSKWTDQNLNVEGEVNLNMPEGGSYMAKYDGPKIFMTVTLKLVEHPTEDPAHLHFKVNLETQNGKGIKSFFHFCTALNNGGLTSILTILEMKDFAGMAPNDELRITVECCVYVPPIKWGFSMDEIKGLTEIMVNGKVGKAKKDLVSKLVEKSRKYGLKGILDCLNALIQENFLEISH